MRMWSGSEAVLRWMRMWSGSEAVLRWMRMWSESEAVLRWMRMWSESEAVLRMNANVIWIWGCAKNDCEGHAKAITLLFEIEITCGHLAGTCSLWGPPQVGYSRIVTRYELAGNLYYYSDVTWASWCLKLLATRLFAQQTSHNWNTYITKNVEFLFCVQIDF